MQEMKYYDYTKNRPLDLESDGCELAEWNRLCGESRFARHPKGFRIFLPPDRLAVSDEYADADPYGVEQTIGGEFHRRRMEITIDLVQKAASSVQGTPRILDLGCGQGHLTQAMSQSLKSAELTGLDYSVSAIEYAHDHFSRIDFAVGDAYDGPYSKGYFDIVVCNNLWEHVPDPLRLLSSIKGFLKPGGYAIVSTPSRYRVGNLMRILRGKPVAFMSEHHVTEYTVGQVVEQFAYGGFKIETILSRPISMGSWKSKLVRKLLAAWVSRVGSHHQLEATVFYLAKKASSSTEQATAADG